MGRYSERIDVVTEINRERRKIRELEQANRNSEQ